MRDPRFIIRHRGGRLSPAHHRLLMQWACACVYHVLPLAQVPRGIKGLVWEMLRKPMFAVK